MEVLKGIFVIYTLAFGMLPQHAEFIALHWIIPVILLVAVGTLTAADFGTGVAAAVAVAVVAGRSDGI